MVTVFISVIEKTAEGKSYFGLDSRLSHLNQRSCGDPHMSKGIIPEGSHLELPSSLHRLPVASYYVQVVIQDHCSEAPLISPERKLCNWTPISAVFRPFQGEHVSGMFRFWVFPSSQVLFPEAAETSVSLYPQVDDFFLLCIIQTPEG